MQRPGLLAVNGRPAPAYKWLSNDYESSENSLEPPGVENKFGFTLGQSGRYERERVLPLRTVTSRRRSTSIQEDKRATGSWG